MPNDTLPVVREQATTLTVTEIKANIQRIHAVFKDVMIGPSQEHPLGVHYGKIPGTGDKPTLLKPGCELILATLMLEAYPVVDDVSRSTDEITYRVKVQIKHRTTGVSLGWGVGECSSNEEKYNWRKVVCDAEFDEADPARRRLKWYRGDRSPYQVKQVRTNPADVANTILKMAKKRALSDGVLTTTACSDIFQQDADDLTPELRTSIYGEEPGPEAPPPPAPGEIQKPAGDRVEGERVSERAPPPAGGAKTLAPGQLKLLRIRMTDKGVPDSMLCAHFQIARVEDLPANRINEAMEWTGAR